MTTPFPDISESWISPVYDAVVSLIQLTAYFDRVNKHEPKRKPGYGLTASVWVQGIRPAPAGSGLSNTSGIITFTARLYANMLQEPQDDIDENLMRAMSNILRVMTDDFDFGLHPLVRNVDLLGQYGESLNCKAGYVELDSTLYRVFDITVPVVVNDIWPQDQTGG